MTVRVEQRGPVCVVVIDRPEVRNAIDGPTAAALVEAFAAFEADADSSVAVLTGAGGTFCAGADLHAISAGRGNRVESDMTKPGPLGPTRMALGKPVIAAIEGYAVAGGLELAVWADLRVAARGSVFGVFCRRWGVPLVDGGSVRLPRIVGHGRAMDMILTGRAVDADEALAIGLVNRLVERGEALDAAVALAGQLAALPQICLRTDRRSAIEQWGVPEAAAMATEVAYGLVPLRAQEARDGATLFARGAGRSGAQTTG